MPERRPEIKPTINNTIVQYVAEEMAARKAAGSKVFPAITPEFMAIYMYEKTGRHVSLVSIENSLKKELTPNLLFYLGDGVWIPQENGFFPIKTEENKNLVKRRGDHAPGRVPRLFRAYRRAKDSYYRS